MHDNEGEENTSSVSEKKEKACDSYVSMYEWGKNFCHSTYERAHTETAICISRMGETVENYKCDYEDIWDFLVVAKE